MVLEASIPTLADRVNRRVARVAPEATALTAAMAVLGDGAARARRRSSPACRGRCGRHRSASQADRGTRRTRTRSRSCTRSCGARSTTLCRSPSVTRPTWRPPSCSARRARRWRRSRRTWRPCVRIGRRRLPPRSPARPTKRSRAPRPRPRFAGCTARSPRTRRSLRARCCCSQPARAEMVLRDPASVAHLQEALELADEPNLRAEIVVVLCELLMALGQWEAGSQLMAQMIAEAGGHDPTLVVELEIDPRADGRLRPAARRYVRSRARPPTNSSAVGDGWAAHALTMLLAAVSRLPRRARRRGRPPRRARLLERTPAGRARRGRLGDIARPRRARVRRRVRPCDRDGRHRRCGGPAHRRDPRRAQRAGLPRPRPLAARRSRRGRGRAPARDRHAAGDRDVDVDRDRLPTCSRTRSSSAPGSTTSRRWRRRSRLSRCSSRPRRARCCWSAVVCCVSPAVTERERSATCARAPRRTRR